jgi:hypothetical protein
MAFPTELTFIDMTRYQFGKKPRLFMYLDHHHGVSWSSVYTSSKSHVVLKLAAVPKRGNVELDRQLSIEKATHHKLSRSAASMDGCSVAFTRNVSSSVDKHSLFLTRVGHYRISKCSIAHREVWRTYPVWGASLHSPVGSREEVAFFPKIIDFGLSNVNHTCPAWKECVSGELKDVWSKLQLDRAI